MSNLFMEVSSVYKSVLSLKVQGFGNCLIKRLIKYKVRPPSYKLLNKS